MDDAERDEERLLDEAIDLAIRLQNDPDNPVSLEMIEAWRARGPEHEAAWRRVNGVHGAAGQLIDERRKAAGGGGAGLSRRSLIVGGAAVLAAGSLVVPGAILRARADHLTGTGEVRDVTLPDGTGATLGPDSALAVDMEEGRRRVELLAGMALFDAAEHGPAPFLVEMEELELATGAGRFEVAADAGVLSLAVASGELVARAGQPFAALSSGQWLTFDSDTRDVSRGTRSPERIGAWRGNLVIAEDLPVSALIARVGRWIPGRIVLADPGIGGQRVSGVFDLGDPLKALRAVVGPAGGHVRQISPYFTLISPV